MANKLPLLGDDFEIWGHWWLPEDPEHKQAGKLTSRFGALELTLLQSFPTISINDRDSIVPVIHGVGDTKLFTLWDAVQSSFPIQFPGTIQQSFRYMRVLVGGHLGERSKTTFTGVTLYGANIGPWSGVRSVDQQLTFPEGKLPTIEYRLSENRSKEFTLPAVGLKMTVGGGYETIDEEYRSYGFKVFPSISVSCDDGLTFLRARNLWQSLSNFLSLSTGAEFITERFSLEVNGGKEHSDFFELRVDHPPQEETNMLKAWEVLTPLSELGDKEVQVFEQWFSKNTEVRDSVDLLIGNLRRRKLPNHVQLSTLCQALESFHRTTIGGGYLSKADYKPINKQLSELVPQDIPLELQTAIKDRLRYAYEFSLRTRLGQLVDQLDEEILKKLAIEKDQFVSDVCKARNDFTHWDKSDAKSKGDNANLLNIISKLNLFTRIVLLKHFGVDEKVIVRRALENKHLYFQEWKSLPVEE